MMLGLRSIIVVFLLGIDVITLISKIHLTAQICCVGWIITCKHTICPLQVLQLCLFTLPDLCWELIFLAFGFVVVLGGVILGRVEHGIWGGCNIGCCLEAGG